MALQVSDEVRFWFRVVTGDEFPDADAITGNWDNGGI